MTLEEIISFVAFSFSFGLKLPEEKARTSLEAGKSKNIANAAFTTQHLNFRDKETGSANFGFLRRHENATYNSNIRPLCQFGSSGKSRRLFRALYNCLWGWHCRLKILRMPAGRDQEDTYLTGINAHHIGPEQQESKRLRIRGQLACWCIVSALGACLALRVQNRTPPQSWNAVKSVGSHKLRKYRSTRARPACINCCNIGMSLTQSRSKKFGVAQVLHRGPCPAIFYICCNLFSDLQVKTLTLDSARARAQKS